MTFRAVSALLTALMLTLASSSRLWHQMNLLMQIVICRSNNRNYGHRKRALPFAKWPWLGVSLVGRTGAIPYYRGQGREESRGCATARKAATWSPSYTIWFQAQCSRHRPTCHQTHDGSDSRPRWQRGHLTAWAMQGPDKSLSWDTGLLGVMGSGGEELMTLFGDWLSPKAWGIGRGKEQPREENGRLWHVFTWERASHLPRVSHLAHLVTHNWAGMWWVLGVEGRGFNLCPAPGQSCSFQAESILATAPPPICLTLSTPLVSPGTLQRQGLWPSGLRRSLGVVCRQEETSLNKVAKCKITESESN